MPSFANAFFLLIAAAIMWEVFILRNSMEMIKLKSPSVSDVACAPDSRYSYAKKKLQSTKNVTEKMSFDGAWMRSRELVYQERRKRVKSACEQLLHYEIFSQDFLGKNVIFDLENELAYCQIAKVGTSTWMRHLVAISKVDEETRRFFQEEPRKTLIPYLHINGQDRKYFDVDDFVETWNLLSFSFVRHPFDRIISAYYNKVCNPKNTYSPLYHNLLKNYDDTTWPTFAQIILDIADERGCYIASSCNIDGHIKPYYHSCKYCMINYDVIGFMEDFYQDFQYIARKQNLTALLESEPVVINDTRDTRFTSQTDRISAHFSKLSKDVRLRLYQLYKMDFEMFGYNASEFL